MTDYMVSNENDTDRYLIDWQVYKCLSCDYLFGNLSDLKRHLKIRHHVQVLGIPGIENISEVEVSYLSGVFVLVHLFFDPLYHNARMTCNFLLWSLG